MWVGDWVVVWVFVSGCGWGTGEGGRGVGGARVCSLTGVRPTWKCCELRQSVISWKSSIFTTCTHDKRAEGREERHGKHSTDHLLPTVDGEPPHARTSI